MGVPSASMTRIRVVLAEDHVLLREGISRLVAANQDLELVGTVGDLPELLALIERERPDVVVTDIRMPPTGTDEGIAAAAWVRRHQPAVGVVVLSTTRPSAGRQAWATWPVLTASSTACWSMPRPLSSPVMRPR